MPMKKFSDSLGAASAGVSLGAEGPVFSTASAARGSGGGASGMSKRARRDEDGERHAVDELLGIDQAERVPSF